MRSPGILVEQTEHKKFVASDLPKKNFGKNTYLVAAWHMVPHVSAMSSTRMAVRLETSPTRTMDATSFARFLSLWMSANPMLSLSAIAVTRLAPPASGDTITASWKLSTCSWIHRMNAGSANRLSTGMSKKP